MKFEKCTIIIIIVKYEGDSYVLCNIYIYIYNVNNCIQLYLSDAKTTSP